MKKKRERKQNRSLRNQQTRPPATHGWENGDDDRDRGTRLRRWRRVKSGTRGPADCLELPTWPRCWCASTTGTCPGTSCWNCRMSTRTGARCSTGTSGGHWWCTRVTYSRVVRGPRSKDPRRRPRGPRNSPLSPSCRSNPASCRTAAVPDIRTKTARVPEKPKPPSRRTPINDYSYVSRHVPLDNVPGSIPRFYFPSFPITRFTWSIYLERG